MGEIFNVLLLQNTLRTATPVVLAALGCLMTQHVNITNIGIDGMMLIGAFFAVLGSYFCQSWLAGVLLALAVGMVLGLFYYLFVIKFHSDEFIIGVALNIFAGGLTVFLLRTIFKVKGSFTGPGIVPLPTVHIPGVSSIPVLGPLLSGNTLLVPICWAFIYKTPLGFHLRASGEYPDALTACGKSPERMKCLASVLCGMLSCLVGAQTMDNSSVKRTETAFRSMGNPPYKTAGLFLHYSQWEQGAFCKKHQKRPSFGNGLLPLLDSTPLCFTKEFMVPKLFQNAAKQNDHQRKRRRQAGAADAPGLS